MAMLSVKSSSTSRHYPSPSPSLRKPPNPKPQSLPLPHIPIPRTQALIPRTAIGAKPVSSPPARRGLLQICRDSIKREDFEGSFQEEEKVALERSGSAGWGWKDWTTTALCFGLYAALMYYVFRLAPNQTPDRDVYFLLKLFNLKGDDGVRMNKALVGLWNIIPFWSLAYSMLLVPTGISSRSKIPIWPFLVLSFIFGSYALLPYFALWKPPPRAVKEDDINSWPVKFLDSKITAVILVAAGLGLIIYAGSTTGDGWKELYQYIRESWLIHVAGLDFFIFTSLAPFWVYTDMTARRWINKGFWLLPISVIPFIGPGLYLLLRPSVVTSFAATEKH